MATVDHQQSIAGYVNGNEYQTERERRKVKKRCVTFGTHVRRKTLTNCNKPIPIRCGNERTQRAYCNRNDQPAQGGLGCVHNKQHALTQGKMNTSAAGNSNASQQIQYPSIEQLEPHSKVLAR